MKTIKLLVLAAGAFAVVLQGKATTITFDDLSGSGVLPANYQGLTWTDWTYYDDSQPPYNPSSGAERIYNVDQSNNNLIQFNQNVTFQGLWMAGYGTGQYVIGYVGGVATYFSTPVAADGNPFGNNISVNWTGVDAISIFSPDFFNDQKNDYYILDDIQFQGAQGVPDGGSTLLLLSSVFGAMGIVRRRFSR